MTSHTRVIPVRPDPVLEKPLQGSASHCLLSAGFKGILWERYPSPLFFL